MMDLRSEARLKRARLCRSARAYRPLRAAPEPLEWLGQEVTQATTIEPRRTIRETLGDVDDIRSTVRSMLQGTLKDRIDNALFGDADSDEYDMRSEDFRAVRIDDGKAKLHEAYFRLVRAILLTETTEASAHEIVDVVQWRLRGECPSLTSLSREAMIRGVLPDLARVRSDIAELEESQAALLARLERDQDEMPVPSDLQNLSTAKLTDRLVRDASPEDKRIVTAVLNASQVDGVALWGWLDAQRRDRDRAALRARREADGVKLTELRSKLAEMERDRDEREREARFIFRRCPTAAEIDALNEFRRFLWTTDDIVERGFLKRFTCPLCLSQTQTHGFGEGVACCNSDCVAHNFVCYFGKAIPLARCAMHDECVADDNAPDALVFDAVPSADGHYFCQKCAQSPRVKAERHCHSCRRGPFCNRMADVLMLAGHHVLATCHRCARPSCSKCVSFDGSAWTCHECHVDELPLLVADDEQEVPLLNHDDLPPLVTSASSLLAFSLDALAYRV